MRDFSIADVLSSDRHRPITDLVYVESHLDPGGPVFADHAAVAHRTAGSNFYENLRRQKRQPAATFQRR